MHSALRACPLLTGRCVHCVCGIQVLLSAGCSVNSADYDKRTCLHLAASTGNRHVVEALLDCGVDVNFTDRWGVRCADHTRRLSARASLGLLTAPRR